MLSRGRDSWMLQYLQRRRGKERSEGAISSQGVQKILTREAIRERDRDIEGKIWRGLTPYGIRERNAVIHLVYFIVLAL